MLRILSVLFFYLFMNKKVWGLIIVITALAIIVGIVYVIFFYKFASPPPSAAVKPPPVQEPVKTVQPLVEPPVKPAATVPPPASLKKAEVGADDLARMASAFAERFGSFSNQSDYGNMDCILDG